MTGPLTLTEWETLIDLAPEGVRPLLDRLAEFHGAAFEVRIVRAYRAQSDPIARFVGECCTTGESVEAKGRTLYEAYHRWLEEGGGQPITETAFGLCLTERGFVKEHTRSGSVYRGLGLRT